MKKAKITTHIFNENNLYESAQIVPKQANFWLLICFGLIVGFINGFWGGGGGMLCVPILTNLVQLPEKNAHATAILIMLPLCIVSLIIYVVSGAVDGLGALKCTIGFIIGGIVGALLLKNIKNVWINVIFAVVIIASGIKMLL